MKLTRRHFTRLAGTGIVAAAARGCLRRRWRRTSR